MLILIDPLTTEHIFYSSYKEFQIIEYMVSQLKRPQEKNIWCPNVIEVKEPLTDMPTAGHYTRYF